jgi:hypothetical protein
MGKNTVNTGAVANDRTGTDHRAAFQALQNNDDQLFHMLSDTIRAGGYFPAMPYASLSAGAAPGATTMYMMPFLIRRTSVMSKLMTYITTAEAAKSFQLSIYAHNYTSGYPTGTPLAATASTLSAATTGAVEGAIVTPVSLDMQLAWLGFQTNSTTAIWQAPPASSGIMAYIFGADGTPANTVGGAQAVTSGVQFANTFGTLPDLSTPPTWGYLQSARMPATYLQHSSVS